MTAEPKLLRGDRLGFLQELTEQGWPMDAVSAALEFWGKSPQIPLPLVGRPLARDSRVPETLA